MDVIIDIVHISDYVVNYCRGVYRVLFEDGCANMIGWCSIQYIYRRIGSGLLPGMMQAIS